VSPSDPRRLLPLIVAISGLGVLTFSLIAPTLPDLADALGVSRGVIGVVQGAVAVPGIFLAILIGYVADLKGRRFVAIVTLLIFGVAGVAGFFLRSFWPLVIARAIQGIGTSAALSLGVVVVGDLFPPGHQRRWALGINTAGITVTGLFAPVLGGWLASGGVFRPFLVYALAFPVALWARRLPGRPDGPPPPPPVAHVRKMFGIFKETGRFTDFAGLLPFSVVVMIVFVGFGFTTTPLFLERVFDVGSTGRGLLQAVVSVGSSIGALSVARLVGWFAPSRLLSSAFFGIVVAFAVLATSPNLWIAAAGLLVLGLGLGVIFPVIQDFVASSVDGAYRGAAVGTWISSIRLGQSVGPIAGSALADGVGERATYGVAAVTVLLVAVLWRPLRRLAWDRGRDRPFTPASP
jgi:MFS family permease